MTSLASTTRTLTGLVLGLALSTGCGAPQKPATAGPPTGAPPEVAPPAQASPDPSAETGPADVAIADLAPDPEREVRIKGVISSVVGMRLVPPKVILKLTDDSGTVTAVINEKAQLAEGTKMELVGKYMSVPSPMHNGPGEAPPEDVFVVERYLDLP